MVTDSRLSRWGPRLVIAGVLIPALLLGMVLLALQVSDRLRALQDSASDNAQWVVLQSEVETLKLMLAVAAAQEAGPEAGLTDVRQWFDILYSRMDLIRSSETYGPKRMVVCDWIFPKRSTIEVGFSRRLIKPMSA